MSLKVTIYTPNRIVANVTTDEVFIPIEIGHFAIKQSFQKHSSAISIGLLRIKTDSSWLLFLSYGGMLEVENDKVTIFLSDAKEIKSLTSSLSQLEDNLKQLAQKRLIKFENTFEKMKLLDEILKLKAYIQAAKYL